MADHFVYMLANPSHTVLYIGMTSNISRRIEEHRMKVVEGFTKKYNCTKFVYFEAAPDRESALIREKELKGWARWKKASFVNVANPTWKDLTNTLE